MIFLLICISNPENILTSKFAYDKITLKKGQQFFFTSDDILGDESGVSVTQPIVIQQSKIGKTILANDGRIKLKIVEQIIIITMPRTNIIALSIIIETKNSENNIII